MSFIHAVIAFEALHGLAQLGWLLAAAPSIAVALTNYPKVASVWNTIAKILNVVSILAHKDSPGTLKPLFVQSKPPPVVGIPVMSK